MWDTSTEAAVVLREMELLGWRLLFASKDIEPVHSPQLSFLDTAVGLSGRLLRNDYELFRQRVFGQRLRLAFHLAPRQAIDYRIQEPLSRQEMVSSFLITQHGLSLSVADSLSYEVAAILDAWDEERRNLQGFLDVLLKRDGNRCAHCHAEFLHRSASEVRVDLFKPYCEDVELWFRPHVDHIEAISGAGTNDLSNLQILCALCNVGKGNGSGVALTEELRHAGVDRETMSEVSVTHRARLLYYVIDRGDRACTRCSSRSQELTVRPIAPDGGYLVSNLCATCYDCAE